MMTEKRGKPGRFEALLARLPAAFLSNTFLTAFLPDSRLTRAGVPQGQVWLNHESSLRAAVWGTLRCLSSVCPTPQPMNGPILLSIFPGYFIFFFYSHFAQSHESRSVSKPAKPFPATRLRTHAWNTGRQALLKGEAIRPASAFLGAPM